MANLKAKFFKFPKKDLHKLQLLLWKNFILQKRHKSQTFFEIAAPVLFCSLIIMIRCLVLPEEFPGVNSYEEFLPWNEKYIFNFPKYDNTNVTIAFSPNVPITRDLITGLLKELKKYEIPTNPQIAENPIGFVNAETMSKVVSDPDTQKNKVLAGVEFDDHIQSNLWPAEVEFSLRFPAIMSVDMLQQPALISWRTNLLRPLFQSPGPRFPGARFGGDFPGYYREMFLMLQYYISWHILKTRSSSLGYGDTMTLRRFPTMPFSDDNLRFILEKFISLFIMLSFAYPAVNTVRAIALEKELQLKEAMKIMGMPYYLHWIAWFIKQMSYLLISIILIVSLLIIPWAEANGKRYAAINYTSWHMLLFLMSIYIICALFFCFMITVFFDKANTAASFTGLVWFVTYTFYTIVQIIPFMIPTGVKMLLSLTPNTAMGFIFEMVIMKEGTTKGLRWCDIFKPVTISSNITPAHILFMFVFDSFLYLLITLYVEKIKPGVYGLPKPWNFPYLYVRDIFKKPVKETKSVQFVDSALYEHVVHDNPPKGKICVMECNDLVKTFGSKPAVKNLSMRLYEDEITVLLGHNGAGKTTTISMLTGMIPPTSGTVKIMGHDIFKENDEARKYLGLCPQHNVLFPDLTVAEHIEFYSRLKGVPKNNVKDEVGHYVRILNMENKKNALSSTLSGGQQRRLSVCTAMCGSSKMVFLDEPSSGLDPHSRRILWDLLLHEKKGKTILLTTHFMDEADVLGDRIAIMSGGLLKCFGSSYFLKEHYGAYYKLIIVKKADCNVKKVNKVINEHIHTARLDSNIGSELIYSIPKSQSAHFANLFENLENDGARLHIESFGFSFATLEDVFVQADSGEKKESTSLDDLSDTSSEEDITREDGFRKVTGSKLQRNHFLAILTKKMLIMKHSYMGTVLQLATMLIHIILVIALIKAWNHTKDQKPLKMSLDDAFESSLTLMAYDDSSSNFIESYREVFDQFQDNIKIKDVGNKDLNEYYRYMYRSDPDLVRDSIYTGITLQSGKVTAWFSNYGYHNVAITMGLVFEALSKIASKGTKLVCYNKPWPYKLGDQITMSATGGTSLGFHLSYSMVFCMAFMCALYIMHSIKERMSQAKLLQLMTGLKPYMLWGGTFLFDWSSFFIISFAGTVVLFCAQEAVMSTVGQFFRVLLVFFLYGMAIIPIHFLMSLFMDSPSNGFTRMCFLNLFFGIAPFLIIEIFNIPDLHLKHVRDPLEIIFLVFPTFCLSQALKYLCETEAFMVNCDLACGMYFPNMKNCTRQFICEHVWEACCRYNHHMDFKKPGISRYILSLFLIAVFVFSLLLILEYGLLFKIKKKIGRKSIANCTEMDKDDDVASERLFVASLLNEPREMEKHALITQNLCKFYKKHLAVNCLTMSLKKGECLGLLGVNGAGKTTTYKILAGAYTPSNGNAWVEQHSITEQLHKIQIQGYVSYCPQFEALFENLTAKENMHIYCLLRGIPVKIGMSVAETLAAQLGFTQHFHKVVRVCSGGTQRKISTALALLGEPKLVLLDEPTTGMDPISKRRIWKVVHDAMIARKTSDVVSGSNILQPSAQFIPSDIINKGTTSKLKDIEDTLPKEEYEYKCGVLLTSHSMEECEALCTRLTVMADGKLQCLGSLQHLKSKFSSGYTLMFKYSTEEQGAKMKEFVEEQFQNPILLDSFHDSCTYYLPDTSVPWSKMFHILEKATAHYKIIDYTLNQTSLEQVFLRLLSLKNKDD